MRGHGNAATVAVSLHVFTDLMEELCVVADVAVTCVVSEECLLPCSFPPASRETIQWFRQDVAVFKFQRRDDDDVNGGGDTEEEEDEDEDEHEDKDQQGQLAGRGSVLPQLVTRGNATLVLRDTGLKDRGTYRCQVTTSVGQHNARVILKVEGGPSQHRLTLGLFSHYSKRLMWEELM